MIDVIGKSKTLLWVAVILIALSWVSVFTFGLKAGIDLKGGTQWRVGFSEEVQPQEIDNFLQSEHQIKSQTKTVSEQDLLIDLPNINEEKHQQLEKSLKEELGSFEEKSFSSVGPTIGKELRNKSMWAGAGVLIGIFLFVAWAFRKVSEPISSWKYGITALIALVHDVSLPLGFFALLGHYQGVEVGTTFIVALLVVLGFSVNDTIVVFDRIRENMKLDRGKKSPKEIINNSVNETFMRSLNTSITLIVVLLSLLVFGPYSLFYFILTIMVGTIAGTYSSLFVASPALYVWGSKN